MRHNIFQRFFYYWQWNVGLVRSPIAGLLDEESEPEVEWLPALPASSFWADPMALEKGGKLYVFYEDFSFRSGKGVISVQTLDVSDGKFEVLSVNRDILALDCHQSYPYLVEDDGRIYCIPETSRAREVALYEAVDFPAKWEKRTVLLPDYAGIDNTVVRHGGKWWLFSTDLNDGIEAKLKLFYADSLAGLWQAHSANPVKDSNVGSRPAGTPFEYQGELFRPAQDSSQVYGGRVVINRVTELSETSFQEEAAKTIEPIASSRFNQALHTVSQAGELTMIDGARQVSIFRSWEAFTYKLKRLLGIVRY
jgi:hypothetical protein